MFNFMQLFNKIQKDKTKKIKQKELKSKMIKENRKKHIYRSLRDIS